jgi:hypothetical protein
MKKFIALAILLIIPVAVCSQSIGGYYGPAPSSVTYALRCWPSGETVADQVYSANQVLDTQAEGCWSGSLKVAGTLAASGSKGTITGAGWYGYYAPSSITRAMGIGIFYTLNPTMTGTDWLESGYQNVAAIGNQTQNIGIGFTTSQVRNGPDSSVIIGSFTMTGATYQTAVIVGGANSSEIPYYSGQDVANYTYGLHKFIKGGTEYANWTLLWKNTTDNSNVYVNINGYANANTSLVSNILVPSNLDFSSILQPTHLSLFATDGELSVYTPTVGTGWTEDSGDWDTASGVLKATAAGIATFDAGVTTAIYDATITTPASGTTNGGMVARYVDSTHYWYLALDDDDNLMRLYEANGSEPGDLRISDAKTIAANTAYKVRLIVSSASPYWSVFVDGVAEGTYTTAGSSSTATKFGLKDEGNANIVGFDNVALWPRTSTTYDTAFAQVGY